MGDRLFNLFPSKIGINPFHATGLFLYPLSDLWISDVSGSIERDQWN